MHLTINQYQQKSGWAKKLDETDDSPDTLIILFGPSDIESESPALIEIRDKFPNSKTIGCSTAGEIYGQDIYDNSLSIAILKFDQTQLCAALHQLEQGEDSFAAGQALANKLYKPDLKAIFILSDGLLVNGSDLVRGLSDDLPRSIVITGGLAGDGERFNHTWVMSGHQILKNHIAAIGFYGDHVRISHGSRGGWDVLGPYREVTRSKANVLYELDGQPALELYKKYLGTLADGLPSTGLLYPLAIRNDEEIDGKTVRTILSIDEQEQSITFAGNLPEGAFVQLMHANFDRLIDGASAAATDALVQEAHPNPWLSIAISCVGRRLVLAQRAEEEVEAVYEILPENSQQIGFYSYGEISPLASGRCDLHNQTMTLTLISEVDHA
jgi:hypothetical protein